MVRTCLSCALFAIVTAPLAAQPSPAPASLQGVWRAVGVTAGDASAPVMRSQPGLIIFTRQHYSIVRVTSDAPRPDLPQSLSQATATQLIATWDPFTANSGSYTVNGSELMTRPLVAKAPPFMKPHAFVAYTWVVKGDTLSLTPTGSQAGRVASPTTIRLVRVEE